VTSEFGTCAVTSEFGTCAVTSEFGTCAVTSGDNAAAPAGLRDAQATGSAAPASKLIVASGTGNGPPVPIGGPSGTIFACCVARSTTST
jgi:hypothetical protein